MDVNDILEKGLKGESLTDNENMVYVVAYLESIADMEGWDHFFTYSMNLHQTLCNTLKEIGDFVSYKVIKDYESHFQKYGVMFESQEIDKFLAAASEEYFKRCPDWREEFFQASELRWDLMIKYFKNIEIRLLT